MLKLNIVSPEIKKELKQKYIYKNTKSSLLLVFFFATLYLTIMLVFKLVLQLHFIETIKQTNMLTRSVKNYSSQVSDINRRINNVKTIQDNHVDWSALLLLLDEIQPDEIRLNEVSVSKDNMSLLLSGNAENRDSLLEYKAALEKVENFSEFEFPIQNLLKEKDIDFKINLSLKNHEFNQSK